MNSKIIIIAILILVKVVGVASRARADVPDNIMDFIKDYQEQGQWEKKIEREKQWREEQFKKIVEKMQWLEDTKTITNIDDYNYIVEYLNGKKEFCIRNDFEELGCVDYSLINYKTSKITSNNPIYRCGNRKAYEDV